MSRKLMLALLLAGSTAAPTMAAKPAGQFLQHAIKGDNSEIMLGRLIERQGASAQVRGFGRTLVHDHSTGKLQAAHLARQMGVAVPSAPMEEARDERTKLMHLHGRAFDREVRRYMINDHEKDIADFRDQARNGDRRTAALARATLPTLRKHLHIAESIRA